MNNDLLNNYICSLLSKPFVIITGSSGTGKTRIALQFAEALEVEEGEQLQAITVNQQGIIQNLNEEQIRDMCSVSNQFTAQKNEQSFDVKIEMCTKVESDDPDFNTLLTESEYTDLIIETMNRPNLNRYEHIPVGADWTDISHLIGYVNLFGPNGNRIYELTPALRLILRALHPDNSQNPYFMILDEMNLSHVERYFSTFLSLMEAYRSTTNPDGIPLIPKRNLELILHTLRMNETTTDEYQTEIETAEILLSENKGIPLPKNIFIVGTINVDETTYMFSPKVLDRAHVIELESVRPSLFFSEANQSNLYLDNKEFIAEKFTQSILRQGNYLNEPSLQFLRRVIGEQQDYDHVLGIIETVLNGIYDILKPVNASFGYRIINEVVEYITVCKDFTGINEWGKFLDTAVLQKVLPKIHGNRRQLTECLKALELFLDGQAATYSWGEVQINVVSSGINLPKCKEKISNMIRVLDHTGYTSFIV
jgi:hypothetical protein